MGTRFATSPKSSTKALEKNVKWSGPLARIKLARTAGEIKKAADFGHTVFQVYFSKNSHDIDCFAVLVRRRKVEK